MVTDTWLGILGSVSIWRREDAQLPPLLALLRLVAASSRAFPDSIVASVICNRLSQYADDASNPCTPPLHLHVQRGLGEEMARGAPDMARDELGSRFPIFRDESAAFGLATASVAPGLAIASAWSVCARVHPRDVSASFS